MTLYNRPGSGPSDYQNRRWRQSSGAALPLLQALVPSPQDDNGRARRVGARRHRGSTTRSWLARMCNRRESATRSPGLADIRTRWLTVPFRCRHPIAVSLHRPPIGRAPTSTSILMATGHVDGE
jgi:hypothetical protein